MSGLHLAILFGSRARGTSGAKSDADVAVLADHPLSLEEKAAMAFELAQKLRIPEDYVDLVDLWDASPLLQKQVADEGKLIEGDEVDLLRFRVLAWKRYQDTARFRRAREQALAKTYDK